MTAAHRRIEAFVVTAVVSFTAGLATMAVLTWGFGSADPVISPAELTPSSGGPASAAEVAHAEESNTAVAPAPDDHPAPIEPPAPALSPKETDAITRAAAELRERSLTLPVAGVKRTELRDTFDEARGAGRKHEAMDILAERNTAVFAVENGTIAKLFLSKAGGITVYQFDPSRRYAYYYAHLERYAPGIDEGDDVKRGQVLGYVGTSGNAPKDTPHLHFAIFALTPDQHWWEGIAIDPFHVFR